MEKNEKELLEEILVVMKEITHLQGVQLYMNNMKMVMDWAMVIRIGTDNLEVKKEIDNECDKIIDYAVNVFDSKAPIFQKYLSDEEKIELKQQTEQLKKLKEIDKSHA